MAWHMTQTMKFFWGGVLAIVVSAIWLVVQSPYFFVGKRAKGTIIRVDSKLSISRHRTTDYWPVVEYKVDNRTYRINGQTSGKDSEFHVGDSMDILYVPSRPADGIPDNFSSLFGGPLILGCGGLLFAGIGVIMALVQGTAKPPDPGSSPRVGMNG